MEEYYDKLHDLHSGQILFPPEVLLHMRPKRCQHVIRVHENVDQSVDDTEEGRMTAGEEFDTDPSNDRHHRVMIEM